MPEVRLIDANALKKRIELTGTPTTPYENGYCDSRDVVCDCIDCAPTIETVQKWIPCSEGLPEDNAEVLVSFCRRYVKIGYIEPGDGQRYWVIPGHSVVPLNYIEAWMPLPEPPESEVQEDAET